MMRDMPRTWGESDTALFPNELQRLLTKMDISLNVERINRHGENKKYSINMAQLTKPFKWRTMLSSSELLTAIRNLTEQSLNFSYESFLDFPILPDLPNGQICDFERLALLKSTHEAIQKLNLSYDTINLRLQRGSFLDLVTLTNDLLSALDIMMTARNNCADATFSSQIRPKTLNESLDWLVDCVLLEYGISREFKNLTVLHKIVALRTGLNANGALTLQEISEQIGLTRERVRQIVQKTLNDELRIERLWPLPPVLEEFINVLSTQEIWTQSQLENLLSHRYGTAWISPNAKIVRILTSVEMRPSFTLFNKTQLVSTSNALSQFIFPTQNEVIQAILNCSEKSGFAQIDDVYERLSENFPDIPRKDLERTIRVSAMYGDLPLDYVYASGRKDKLSPVSRALLMLAWAGELTIDEIWMGLDRYGRFRKMAPPPPHEVLQDFYKRRNEFILEGNVIRASISTKRDEKTIEGQIATLCEQQEGAVMSKALIHDHFRQLGRFTSSVSMYITYSPILRPVGAGCITIVGHHPTTSQIEAARELAKNFSIDTEISWLSQSQFQIVEVLVGTAFRDSGVLSISGQKSRWLEGRRFTVQSEDSLTHGSLSVSGNFFYGFTPFLNAQRVEVGDSLRIELNTSQEIATIRVNPIQEDV